MIESLKSDKLEYRKLSKEEMQQRGILGRLVGVCADTINETRNGRKYSAELWEKAFNSPLVKEQFRNGGIFGQLCHPDYSEVNLEKVALCMPEPPKKDRNGKLIALFDILDTPCGNILNSLCRYGYKIGISTRGEGDIITDMQGNESVDPDTYTLNALDAVVIPAVEAARLQYMTESFDTSKSDKKNLKESLSTLLTEASAQDKVIMEESLEELGIFLGESVEDIKEDGNNEKDFPTNMVTPNSEDSARQLLEIEDEDVVYNDQKEDKVEEDFEYTMDDGNDVYPVKRKKALRKVFDFDEKKLEDAEDEAMVDGSSESESEDGEITLTIDYEPDDDLSDETIRNTIREIIVNAADKYDFDQDIDFLDDRLSITISNYGSQEKFKKNLTKIVDDILERLGLPVKVNGKKGTFKLSANDITLARHNKAGEEYTKRMFSGQLKSNNSSGVTGVSYEEDTGMWRAYITVDGERIVVGHYDSKKKARKARQKAVAIATNTGLDKQEKIDKIKDIELDESLSAVERAVEGLKEAEGEVNEDKPSTTAPSSNEGVETIKAIAENRDAAEDVGADLVTGLQEALIENSNLKSQITALQEKLSVCYTKEEGLEEQVRRYKGVITNLNEKVQSVEPLRQRVKALMESNTRMKEEYTELENVVSDLNESVSVLKTQKKQLSEQLEIREDTISEQSAKIKSLCESIKKVKAQSESEVRSLNESIQDTMASKDITEKRYQDKLEQARKLVEKYKQQTQKTLDKYIDSQAVKLGVSSKDIKCRLEENYTFEDIDNICESLYSYTTSVNKLPFSMSRGTKVVVTDQVDPIVQNNRQIDVVDDDLLSMVGLK